jgi:hypothetical protein
MWVNQLLLCTCLTYGFVGLWPVAVLPRWPTAMQQTSTPTETFGNVVGWALCYKPEGLGSIPDEVIAFFN